MKDKIKLFEAKGLVQSDYTSGEGTTGQEVWNLVDRGNYEEALKKATGADYQNVINKWVFDNYPRLINQEDEKSLKLVGEWVDAFNKDVNANTNPFVSYLDFLKNNLNSNISYNALLNINNSYAEGVIGNEDLKEDTMPLLLKNSAFYSLPSKDQDDLLGYWKYLSDSAYLEKVLEKFEDGDLVFDNGETPLPKTYYLNNPDALVNYLYFDDVKANEKGVNAKLNSVDTIRQNIRALSSNLANKKKSQNDLVLNDDELTKLNSLMREKGISIEDIKFIASLKGKI